MKQMVMAVMFFGVLALHPQHQQSGMFSSFDGTRLYYETNGRGEPVILVHGFIVDSDSWKRTALYGDLLQQGMQVITLDLRGNGQSDRPHAPAAYEGDAEAKDIIALAGHLELRQYSIAGYSRGAIIASRVLMLDPRVDKTVLGGMGADFINPKWPKRIRFYEALSGEPSPEFEGALRYIEEQQLDRVALACMQKAQPHTTKKEFSNVKKPVLVICGADDEENGSSEALAALIPGATLVRPPGDHNNTLRSKAFSDAVVAFLRTN